MEEDCRQKKSTLTPAPRGREEVAHSFLFFVIGLVVGVIVDVGSGVVVVDTIQTPQTHFSSLTSPWVLSPHSTGAKVATPAKVKTWPSCSRSEIIQVL